MRKTPAQRPPAQRARVVERAIAILNCFSAAQEKFTLQQLVEKSGLHKDTVFRIAGTLTQVGILVQDVPGPTYSLGYVAMAIPRLVLQTNQLRIKGLAVLEEMRDLVNETCVLSARIKDEVFNIDKTESSHIIGEAPIMGQGLLLHENGAGLAILSTFEDGERERYFRRHDLGSTEIDRLATIGRSTPVVRSAPDAAGKTIVHIGLERPEWMQMSVPIIAADGDAVGALSVTIPGERAKGRLLDRCEVHLRASADKIGGSLALS